MPDNTLPMMGGAGPYGSIEMGGMFTVVKIRPDLAPGDYRDPGWYQPPRNRSPTSGQASLRPSTRRRRMRRARHSRRGARAALLAQTVGGVDEQAVAENADEEKRQRRRQHLEHLVQAQPGHGRIEPTGEGGAPARQPVGAREVRERCAHAVVHADVRPLAVLEPAVNLKPDEREAGDADSRIATIAPSTLPTRKAATRKAASRPLMASLRRSDML